MKRIKLTQEKYAIVDNEDFEFLNQFKWHFTHGYAFRYFGKKYIGMHRIIMNTPQEKEVDHINHNGLDNRKINLKNVTTAQNQWNRNKSITNTSGFKGVAYHKRDKYWQTSIRINGKRKYLGSFKTKEEAALLYIKATQEREAIFGGKLI